MFGVLAIAVLVLSACGSDGDNATAALDTRTSADESDGSGGQECAKRVLQGSFKDPTTARPRSPGNTLNDGPNVSGLDICITGDNQMVASMANSADLSSFAYNFSVCHLGDEVYQLRSGIKAYLVDADERTVSFRSVVDPDSLIDVPLMAPLNDSQEFLPKGEPTAEHDCP